MNLNKQDRRLYEILSEEGFTVIEHTTNNHSKLIVQDADGNRHVCVTSRTTSDNHRWEKNVRGQLRKMAREAQLEPPE